MKKHLLLSRRTVLRGLGAAVSLPLLEAMLPDALGITLPKAASKPPLRMAFVYVPNGVNVAEWTPAEEGDEYELSRTLAPLVPVKDDLLVLSGLAQRRAYANGDGPGDHARAMSTFLTGVQVRKTAGADIRAGISVDQVAASKVGKATRFASLEIGCEQIRDAGNCDSGYSCAYSNNLSWRSETTPNYKEIDPRQVFDRLFGAPGKTDAGKDKRDLYRKSILDYVAEDAQALRGKLGSTDQHKLDEYLCGIREIELRIARDQPRVEIGENKLHRPTGGYSREKYQEHLRIMADLLVLAFQGDQTRISTFAFANDGSNRSYRFIDVPDGHHDLSHHGGDKVKLSKIQKINQFHTTQFAYLLQKLKSVKEGAGTLLDSCMIVYGSGIGDGNRHNHNELPILLAGKGGGTIETGRHVRFPRDTPLNNLYLTLLDRMGAPVDALGDSTGRLKGLEE
jgi:hypothetical protein